MNGLYLFGDSRLSTPLGLNPMGILGKANTMCPLPLPITFTMNTSLHLESEVSILPFLTTQTKSSIRRERVRVTLIRGFNITIQGHVFKLKMQKIHISLQM